jgi:hypothetical protein
MVIRTGRDLIAWASGSSGSSSATATIRDAAKQIDKGEPLDEKTLVELRLRRISGQVIAYRSR